MAKLLVVDDDPVCSRLLPSVLENEGFEVRSASTAAEAIELGADFQPDILIADWMLKHQKDGVDVARSLLQIRPDLRIIFVTGLPAEHLTTQLKGVTFQRILEKPLDLDDLLKEIRRAVAELTPT